MPYNVSLELEKSVKIACLESQKEGEDISNYITSNVIVANVQTVLAACNVRIEREYREKYRIVTFNMNDPNNKELRKAVCKGELPFLILMYLREADLTSSSRRAELEVIQGNTNKNKNSIFIQNINTFKNSPALIKNTPSINSSHIIALLSKAVRESDHYSFLPSCGIGNNIEWNRTFITLQGTEKTLIVRIHELVGQGPLRAMIPKKLFF